MATHLLDHLPALYRSADAGADLERLLGVFDELLFSGDQGDLAGETGDDSGSLPGIEHQLDKLLMLLAPFGLDDTEPRSPAHFLPWIASWLAFTPHRHFGPEQLRRIIAGIVPLYGRRGTRAYLERLLALCFDEIAAVQVDERGGAGLRLGLSVIGVDTLLAEERAFWFNVDVQVHRESGELAARLEQRLRAVIDFAKPAHTAYELRLR